MAKSRARRPGGRTPRTRRTAEQARRLILDAAEARLREGGPEALRLKDIARDAGISHPTILHHFESREGLVQALLLRGMDRLESALAAVVEAAPATPQTVTAATERIFAALGDAGHARLLAWRALEAGTPDPEREDPVLRRLADLVHARRAERRHRLPHAPHRRRHPRRRHLRPLHRLLARPRRPLRGPPLLPHALREAAVRAPAGNASPPRSVGRLGMSEAGMPCPSCRGELEPTPGRHGIVWLCRSCRAGAATLPILRRIAPRAFVDQVWQAALHEGRASSTHCPSCGQPFTTFRGSEATVEPELEVCTRCYWVWLGPASLSSLARLRDPPTLVQRAEELGRALAVRDAALTHPEARRSLRWWAGWAVLSLLP